VMVLMKFDIFFVVDANYARLFIDACYA